MLPYVDVSVNLRVRKESVGLPVETTLLRGEVSPFAPEMR